LMVDKEAGKFVLKACPMGNKVKRDL